VEILYLENGTKITGESVVENRPEGICLNCVNMVQSVLLSKLPHFNNLVTYPN
jgi:hypothetical protein